MTDDQNLQTDGATEPAVSQSTPETTGVLLNTVFAFKKGMSAIYDENGRQVPVTVLEYKPWRVSQIKTDNRDGYQAVQIACSPRKRSSKALTAHLTPAGFENGAHFVKEVRQTIPQGCSVGQVVEINSLKIGDVVKVTGTSKGRGFAGVHKRWNFGGGPAAHGSGFHRRPGSIGNRTWPGRVMPGRKLPGHFGAEKITIKNLEICAVLPDVGAIIVKGSVPGAPNSLIEITKVAQK